MLNIMEDKSHPNPEDRNSTWELHNSLSRICKNLATDFQPWGDRDRDAEWGPDCSCGCKFFLKLPGQLGNDWGVCWNPESPRCGLLTFEHQGCRHFVEEEELWEEKA